MKQLQPLKDNVVVRIIHPERMTASQRLFIPETAQRREYELYQAKVIAKGQKAQDVEIGDRVLVYWAGMKIHATGFYDDEEEYQVVSQSSIQGVLC